MRILAAALVAAFFMSAAGAAAAPSGERMPALFKYVKVNETTYSCAEYVPGMDLVLRTVMYDPPNADPDAAWYAARAWFLADKPARPILVTITEDLYAEEADVTVYVDHNLDGEVDAKFDADDENFPGACQVIQKYLKSP